MLQLLYNYIFYSDYDTTISLLYDYDK